MATNPTMPMIPPGGGGPSVPPSSGMSPSMAPNGLEPMRMAQALVQLARNLSAASPAASAETEQIINLAQGIVRKLVLASQPQQTQAPPV